MQSSSDQICTLALELPQQQSSRVKLCKHSTVWRPNVPDLSVAWRRWHYLSSWDPLWHLKTPLIAPWVILKKVFKTLTKTVLGSLWLCPCLYYDDWMPQSATSMSCRGVPSFEATSCSASKQKFHLQRYLFNVICGLLVKSATAIWSQSRSTYMSRPTKIRRVNMNPKCALKLKFLRWSLPLMMMICYLDQVKHFIQQTYSVSSLPLELKQIIRHCASFYRSYILFRLQKIVHCSNNKINDGQIWVAKLTSYLGLMSLTWCT